MLESRDPMDQDPQAGCKLMDGFGIFIQLCLATTAFSTLIYKRQREKPQRPLRIWALDVSKQLAGGILVHSLNVIAAVFFGIDPEEGEKSNPCVWYFLNILVDTTLGIGILWLILTGFKHLILRLEWHGFQSGVYGEPPFVEQLKKWLKQLVVYIVSLILMKVVVVSLFHLCPWISDFGDWVLQWTVGNYRLQVAFVMLIFPLVMNIMQFWVIDTMVKHKSDKPIIRLSSASSRDEEEDVQTLLRHEEEEEDHPPPPDYHEHGFQQASSSNERTDEYELGSKN